MIAGREEFRPLAFPPALSGHLPRLAGEEIMIALCAYYSAACFSGSMPGGLFEGFQRRIGLRAASVSSRRRRGA